MNTNIEISKTALVKGLKVETQGDHLIVKAEKASKQLVFVSDQECIVVFLEDPTTKSVEMVGEHSCKRLDSLFIESYLNWYVDILEETKGRLASSLSSMILHMGDLEFCVTTDEYKVRATKSDISYTIKMESSDRGANNYFVVSRKGYGEIIRIKSDIITGYLLAKAVQKDWEVNSHRFLDVVEAPVETPIDIITKSSRKFGYACDVSKLDLGFETLLSGSARSMIFVNGRDTKHMVTFVVSENASDTIKVSQRYAKIYEGPNNLSEADYERFIKLAGEPLF